MNDLSKQLSEFKMIWQSSGLSTKSTRYWPNHSRNGIVSSAHILNVSSRISKTKKFSNFIQIGNYNSTRRRTHVRWLFFPTNEMLLPIIGYSKGAGRCRTYFIFRFLITVNFISRKAITASTVNATNILKKHRLQNSLLITSNVLIRVNNWGRNKTCFQLQYIFRSNALDSNDELILRWLKIYRTFRLNANLGFLK